MAFKEFFQGHKKQFKKDQEELKGKAKDFQKEYEAICDKYGLELAVGLDYQKHGIFPKIELIKRQGIEKPINV
jgi:hypothetical protein